MIRQPTQVKLLLCIGAAVCCSSALAQQTASASFGPTKPVASADFAKPVTPAAANCTPAVRPAVACVHPPARQHRARTSSALHATNAKPVADKPLDPLAIHPDAAIKDSSPREIVLPGVMKIPGASPDALDFSRSRVVDVSNNGSQSVYLSDTDQNRIQVPWTYPKLVGTDELIVDEDKKSNNLYLQFKEGVTRPVQIYIEQKDGGRTVLGLQVIPKHIPGQTILVRDVTRLAGDSIKAPKGNDYVSQTQALMETVALGGAPQGFSQIALKLPPIVMNGLMIEAQQEFSSADREMFVYLVTNPAKTTVTLDEHEFDGDSVLAVSIFPTPILHTNEQAKVIVIARKQKD